MDIDVPDVNVVRIAVDLACRAPSVHNSQPWQWKFGNGRLDLFTERGRLLSSTDPSGRQLVLSCGAALDHLRIALTAFRWSVEIDRLPDGPHSTHLAAIRFRRDAHPQSHDFDLLAAIRHRHSDRRPFRPLGENSGLNVSIPEVVRTQGTRVTVLPADARSTLAAATALTASARKYDSGYQAELHWWAGHSISDQGMPADTLASSEDQSRVGIGRSFPSRRDGAVEVSAAETDRSTVVVLSTETDDRIDWLRCGEALSAVLLEATVNRAATCPLTHVTELHESRSMIRQLLPDRGFPQALIRIGMADRSSAPGQTPRRPTESVLSVQGAQSPLHH